MIASIGESVINFKNTSSTEYESIPGGAVLNSAIAISRLGVESEFIGRISKDFFGHRIMNYLKNNGVKTSMCTRAMDKSTLVFNTLDQNNHMDVNIYDMLTSDLNWKWSEINNIHIPDEAKIINFGSLSIANNACGEKIMDIVCMKQHRCLLAFDVSVKPCFVKSTNAYLDRFDSLVSISDIVKMTTTEMKWLLKDDNTKFNAQKLHNCGAKLVVFIHENGDAEFFTETARAFIPKKIETEEKNDWTENVFFGAMLVYAYQKKWYDNGKTSKLTVADLEAMGHYAMTATTIDFDKIKLSPSAINDLLECKL